MHSNKILEQENRLQKITNQLANLKRANPDLANCNDDKYKLLRKNIEDSIKEYRILLDKIAFEKSRVNELSESAKVSPSQFILDQLNVKFDLIEKYYNQRTDIMDKMKFLNAEKDKYNLDEYKEYLNLLKEQETVIQLINSYKDQTLLSGFEPANNNKGRALQKVDVLSNLDITWCNKFCDENNLLFSKNENEAQFKSKDNSMNIVVKQYSVNGKCANEAAIDLMIKIYLKSIEDNTEIVNHAINHTNDETQKIVERKLALAIKGSIHSDSKINGKSTNEILDDLNVNPNKENNHEHSCTVSESESNNSFRLK